jgi:O-antigen biosynthesis protein
MGEGRFTLDKNTSFNAACSGDLSAPTGPVSKSDAKGPLLAKSWVRKLQPSWINWFLRCWRLLTEMGPLYVARRALKRLRPPLRYDPTWIRSHDNLTARDIEQIRIRIEKLPDNPLFSIILSPRDASSPTFGATLKSIVAQLYPRWQLFIISQSSVGVELPEILTRNNSRIAVLSCNIDCMEQIGTALAQTTGEFVVFLEQEDALAPHALYMMAEEINARQDTGLIYVDEDQIDNRGRRSNPCFKPDWNPDLFLSQDYLGHALAFRRDLVTAVGGVRSEFASSKYYDLAMRIVEQIKPETIRHIPFVLNHRSGSDSNIVEFDGDAVVTERRVLREHLNRTGTHGNVEASHSGRHHRLRRHLPRQSPRVSIIIPTRDHLELLKGTIDSIRDTTDYPNYEIVIVDNQSADSSILLYLASIAEQPQVRVLRYDDAFNYSAINNFAARHCTEALVLALLNNDVLVINPDWLTEMVSQAVRPEVGAVGAMLYYPDGRIQHAGIIVGAGGVAANYCRGLQRGSTGYFSRAELIQNYSAVTAACLVTRSELFADVGGFDEANLKVAFNDVDYCLRLRERGYLIAWTPYAELYHLESASRGDDISREKSARFRREQQYFAKRWSDLLPRDPYYNINLSLDGDAFAIARSPRSQRPWLSE